MSSYAFTDCKTCGREFDTYASKEECDFCKGDETCSEEGCTAQATILFTEDAQVRCAAHWKECCEENDETVEECEEFVVRLEETRHAKPKEDK